jgi:hypothetical protein
MLSSKFTTVLANNSKAASNPPFASIPVKPPAVKAWWYAKSIDASRPSTVQAAEVLLQTPAESSTKKAKLSDPGATAPFSSSSSSSSATPSKAKAPTHSPEAAAAQKVSRAKGTQFSAMTLNWLGHYEELKQFRKAFGHCNVSRKNAMFKSLGHWVRQQRRRKKQFKLNPKQIELLDELGFEWDRSYYLYSKSMSVKSSLEKRNFEQQRTKAKVAEEDELDTEEEGMEVVEAEMD